MFDSTWYADNKLVLLQYIVALVCCVHKEAADPLAASRVREEAEQMELDEEVKAKTGGSNGGGDNL